MILDTMDNEFEQKFIRTGQNILFSNFTVVDQMSVRVIPVSKEH
jgi:hypothetical protein